MTINILGEKWELLYQTNKEDVALRESEGYCDWTIKKIVIAEIKKENDSLQNMEEHYNRVKKHEIIHAFLFESGLGHESNWAHNEVMVDWFARQWDKINKCIIESKELTI